LSTCSRARFASKASHAASDVLAQVLKCSNSGLIWVSVDLGLGTPMMSPSTVTHKDMLRLVPFETLGPVPKPVLTCPHLTCLGMGCPSACSVSGRCPCSAVTTACWETSSRGGAGSRHLVRFGFRIQVNRDGPSTALIETAPQIEHLLTRGPYVHTLLLLLLLLL